MAKNFKGLVFEPFKEGIESDLSADMFKDLVGREWEVVPYPDMDNISIIQVEGGIFNSSLKRHRGVSGTFILASNDNGGFKDLTDKEIKALKKKLDKLPQYPSSNKYLQTFFEEKDLELKVFYYERDSKTIPVTNIEVIERFLAQSDTITLKKAEDILRRIDFANGDVNHFLEHIGNVLADMIYEECEKE